MNGRLRSPSLAIATLLAIGLAHAPAARAQSMDDLLMESIATAGVNVTYALDAAQCARFAQIVDAVNAEAGTALRPTCNVILFYIDLANVRGGTGTLIGNGRAVYLAFLGVALTPTNGTEVIGFHAFTDSAALAAYFEQRGLGGYVTVADRMSTKWTMNRSDGGDTRTLRFRMDSGGGLVHLDVDEMPLVAPGAAVDSSGAIDFYTRNLPHAAVAIGLDNTGEQFTPVLGSYPHDVRIARLSVPIVAGGTTVDLMELFPGNAGITRIRTESRYWRWWRQ